MKRIRHTAEQIIRKLKTAEQLIALGKTVAVDCRAIQVTRPTYSRWRQQYGGMQPEESILLPSWRMRMPVSSRRLLRRSRSFWQKLSWRQRCSTRRPGAAVGVGRLKPLSPQRCRRAVAVLQERYWASECQACRVLGQHRSTQRLPPRLSPQGPADGVPPASERGLEREPHSGATDLAGGRTAAAHS